MFGCSDDEGNPCEYQPTIVTLNASNITDFSATLNGTINVESTNCDSPNNTEQGFVYSTTIQPTINDNIVNVNGTDISTSLENLEPETTYYYRAFLTNAFGEFYGNDISFETAEETDSYPPVITITGDNPLSIIQFDDYEELGATAVDVVDGNLTDNIQISSNVNTQVIGNYQVVYSVSDSSGNSTSVTREVSVFGSPVYLDDNGITIKAYDWAVYGMSGEVNGIDYLIVSANDLRNMISNNENVNVVCTSFVTNMNALIENNLSFNQNINNWDVSNVTEGSRMFFNSNFNSDISAWNVGSVTNMNQMFQSSQFNNSSLYNWDMSAVEDLGQMFYQSSFNQNIGQWNLSSAISIRYIFASSSSSFNDPSIALWDVSNITDMVGVFHNNTNFNQNINSWNVSNVTDMSLMFRNAESFNQPLNNWNVGNVIYFDRMFHYADSFNQTLNNWDVSTPINMQKMFAYTIAFNQNINNWDVSNVTDMWEMFSGSNFNQPIGSWDVSNVSNMRQMFAANFNFNSDISTWNVSNVNNMYGMFSFSSFNQDIGDWDVSNVNDMGSMFYNASTFNQPLGDWDVSNVNNMGYMFSNASAFNQPLGDWDVSNVNDMGYMFSNASAFNQPLGDWNVDSVTNCNNFCEDNPNWTLSKPNFTNCESGCD